MNRFFAWLRRSWAADDPAPTYSDLDVLDGLDYAPHPVIINPSAFSAWAARHAGGGK